MNISKMALFAVAPLALATTQAGADNFSFAGNLSSANDVLLFNFTVGSASSVTLRTYSYAGGTNAQGTVIARGGFDPILSLFNASTGTQIASNDDGGSSNVPADPTTGHYYDTFLQQVLNAGTYTVAVSAYSNFAGATLATPFSGAGNFNGRDTHWAFDVLGAAVATGPGSTIPSAAPEPATWALMVVGFGAIGFAMRRRRNVSTRVTFA